MSRKQMTDEEMEAEDNRMREVNKRDARIWAVREKLEALGITPLDLIECLEDAKARDY
jgi:DNA-binding protein H-NS